MKLILARGKPRNPVAPAARQRRAGTHRTSTGARRQQAARALRAELARPFP